MVSSKMAKLEFPRFSRDDPTEWFNRVNHFLSSKILPKPKMSLWPLITWKERPTNGGSGLVERSKKKDEFSHG